MSDEFKEEETKETNTEEKPELSDEQLDDASGGYAIEMKKVYITSYQTGGSTGDVAEDPEGLTERNIGSSGQDG